MLTVLILKFLKEEEDSEGETNCIFGWNSGGFNMAIYGTCVWGLSDYYVYIKDSLIGGSNAIQNWEKMAEEKNPYRLLKY